MGGGKKPAAGGAVSEPLSLAFFGQINTSTPNPKQSQANKDGKRTIRRLGEEGEEAPVPHGKSVR